MTCRFLYPIYPLICVAAASVIESFPDFFYERYSTEQSLLYKVNHNFILHMLCMMNSLTISLLHMQIAKFVRPVVLGFILCLSHSRTFSIINGYSAPLEIYKHFEHHDDAGTGKNYFAGLSKWVGLG